MYKIQQLTQHGWSDVIIYSSKSTVYFYTYKRAMLTRIKMFGANNKKVRIVDTERNQIMYKR